MNKDERVFSVELAEDEIEGYAYCETRKDVCMNDCLGPWHGTPTLSDVE
ncbi:hypothetical protein QA584_25745 [Anaerocolumna sp. AGMB13025]|jgi:hypothetical protein|nr:hypothetical protein [Anaerocolumna sp. AGMB13025]WFR56979.1 hypothetical protein QA584_25745 [Anaerocolumna sp. AGMB13025]